SQLERALVHVDGVHGGVRRTRGECERNRPVSAAEVEDRPGDWRSRGLPQQHTGADVEVRTREHAAVGLEPENPILDVHRERDPLRRDIRPLLEIMAHEPTVWSCVTLPIEIGTINAEAFDRRSLDVAVQFPDSFFDRADNGADAAFYSWPRLV